MIIYVVYTNGYTNYSRVALDNNRWMLIAFDTVVTLLCRLYQMAELMSRRTQVEWILRLDKTLADWKKNDWITCSLRHFRYYNTFPFSYCFLTVTYVYVVRFGIITIFYYGEYSKEMRRKTHYGAKCAMREESSELPLERERAFSVLKQIDVAYLDGAWHKTKENQWTIDSIKIGKKDIVFAHELQTILHDETKPPWTKKPKLPYITLCISLMRTAVMTVYNTKVTLNEWLVKFFVSNVPYLYFS